MLQPQIFTDREAVSQFVADHLCEQLRYDPNALWCLATGATPTRTYELLAARGAANPELFAGVRVLNLDEWGGLPPDDPGSCSNCLRSTLIGPLGLESRFTSFSSQSPDPEAECQRIAVWLQQHGPIDLCLLGLGVNGHVGFNEPADFLQLHAHVAELSEASLAHAMIRSSRARPSYGLTLGMGDLLQSHRIVMLATGPTKRRPIDRLLDGVMTTQFPASLLHAHPRAMLLCDEAACPAPRRLT